MRLALSNDTWLEITKGESAQDHAVRNVEFSLDHFEFEALKQKLSFFYYRKGPSRFLVIPSETGPLKVIDPDGRNWMFKKFSPHNHLPEKDLNSVRMF